MASRASELADRMRTVAIQGGGSQTREQVPTAGTSRRRGRAGPQAGDIGDRPHLRAEKTKARKPKRLTLDLSREQHRFLKRFALECEDADMSKILRVLLDLLRNDSNLAAHVRARIDEGIAS